MAVPLLLRVSPASDGRWRMLVGRMVERLAEGEVDAARVSAVTAALTRWESARPVTVPVPRRDAEHRRAEEDLGRALVRTLGASQELTQRFAASLGAARARNEPLVVMVDVADPELRRIPWELLAADAEGLPLESAGAGVVARLSQVSAGAPNSVPDDPGVDVAVWCPTPEDPVCAAVLADLDDTLRRHEVGPALRLDPVRAQTPPPRSGSVVLHVVCHGRRDADEVRLLLDGTSAGGPTAVARLNQWVASADVLILDVCEAGAATDHLLDALPGRLLASGAHAVVAPTRRCSTQAARAFSAGFYAGWTEGRSLAGAVARGRTEVAALGLGLVDTRWYNHVLYAPDAESLFRPGPQPAIWRPAGWPRPGRDAEALLQTAKALADQAGQGFVGVEHLGLALVHGAGNGVLTTRVRAALSTRARAMDGLNDGRFPKGDQPRDPRGTPRLQRYGALLRPNFTSDDLCTLLVADRGCILQVFSRPRLLDLLPRDDEGPVGVATIPEGVQCVDPTTLDGPPLPSAVPLEIGPAQALEVMGGPEDGRVLDVRPEEVIARYGASPEAAGRHVLYAGTYVFDRRIHRVFARWLGPGRIAGVAACTVRRGDAEEVADAGSVVALAIGDVVQFSPGTWLRGVRG